MSGRGELTVESEALLRDWLGGIDGPFRDDIAAIEAAAAREALDLAHRRFHATTTPVVRCDCDPYTWDPGWHDRHVARAARTSSTDGGR